MSSTLEKINLRIIDSKNSSDLIFGQQRKYPFSELKFTISNNQQAVPFTKQDGQMTAVAADSIIQINLLNMPNSIDIYWKDQKLETLSLGYTTLDTECCGDIRNLSSSTNTKGDNLFNTSLDIITIKL
jgi:hypothetical protein